VTVLVCGDRNWTDNALIREVLEKLPRNEVLIHGDARGADKIGGKVAESLGLIVKAYPADWSQFGNGAGPIRNQAMLDVLLDHQRRGRPVAVHAFHDDIPSSKGTADMVRRSVAAGVEVEVHSHTTGTERRSAGNEGAIRGRLETLWTTIETCHEKERVAMREIRELEGRL
jgi:hypothetical protein